MFCLNSARALDRLLALVHHPLAVESGISKEQAESLRASEQAALSAARHVVVTSAATAQQLSSHYAVPAERITVVRPGSDPVRPAPRSADDTVRLLSVGAVVPRKGYDVLIAALATLPDLHWSLTIAGDCTRNPKATAHLKADIERLGLGNRVAVLGAVSRSGLANCMRRPISSPSPPALKAMAWPMPKPSRTACRSSEQTRALFRAPSQPDAGLLVAPDDATAFASALRRLIGNADERRRFADAARSGGQSTPDLAGVRKTVLTRAGDRDMTGFSADWLTLREPFDMRARNPSVLDAVAASLATYPSARIVDLACGTGSTLRALSAGFHSGQNWILSTMISACWHARRQRNIATMWSSGIPLDLNRDLEAALDGPVDLVTTSALLDLVSESWLERLTVEIAARAIPFYAALSYEGTIDSPRVIHSMQLSLPP